MLETWTLRWDTRREEKPSIILPEGAGSFSLVSFGQDQHSLAVFDGYLFEKENYGADAKASEAECLARAYQKYGENVCDVLRGGFNFAIWDHLKRKLLTGRDPTGLYTYFYHWDNGFFIMSPVLDNVLAQDEVASDFNRLVIAEHLQNLWPAQQRTETFYKHIQRLPPAHQLSIHQGKLTTTRYWDPLPTGFEWATQEEIATFEPTLEQAVARCLSVGADSIALSGGYDSVSIAILAKEQLNGKRPLHAISLRFEDRDCDEGVTQIAVARALNLPQTILTLRESLKGTDYVEASLELSRTSPCPVLSLWQSMYTGLLNAAAKYDLHNLLMGTGGDEMLIVDQNYAKDLLASFDLAGLWHYYRAVERSSPFPPLLVAQIVFWQGAIRPELRQLASRLLGSIAPGYKEQLRRQRHTPMEWINAADQEFTDTLIDRQLQQSTVPAVPGEGAYIRTIRALPQAPMFMVELDQSASWARHTGFKLMLPFFDRDLVELLLRVHPKKLLSDGRVKSPLRHLVTERLPSVKLPSEKVNFTRMSHGVLRSDGLKAWQKLGGASMLAQLDIIEKDRLDALMEGYFNGQHDHWIRAWLVLGTETWLQSRAK